jgi:uncharacterized membrane protein HdeD (DUF308 family)
MTAEDTPLLATPTIFVGVETLDEIQQNWHWIGAFGLFNVVFGTFCLLFPVLASQAVELALSYAVLMSGSLHLAAVCFVSPDTTFGNHHKAQLFTVGIVQIVLAALMFTQPFGVLTISKFGSCYDAVPG